MWFRDVDTGRCINGDDLRFIEFAHPMMCQYALVGIDAELGFFRAEDVDYRGVFGAWHGSSFPEKCCQRHIVEKKKKAARIFASPPRFITAASPAGTGGVVLPFQRL